MHTYVSRLKDTELKSLIATYDIPLDLRPRLPDPNFRMINLPVGDTAIGIYSRIFYSSGVRIPFSSFLLAGDWFSFAKRGGPAPVCMEVAKSGLKLWKDKFFLIDRRAIPFHMPWRHPDSFMSIHAFLCMPSLDKVMVREEPHELGTSILSRVVDRTTSHVPAGTIIPPVSPEEIAVTRPDRNIESESAWAGSSGLAAVDGVEQTDDGTLDDDGQRDGSEFAMEDIGNLNDVSQDKEVEAHAELSGGVRRTTRASSHASHGVSEDASSPAQEAVPAPDTQPLDTDAGADEIASDGNVDPYYEARVSNTARDVLERDLLPIILGPYYTLYPYAEDHTCQLVTHGSVLNARYDHSLKNVERLTKLCAQQTQIIKKQGVDLKQQKESTVHANEEVSRLTADLEFLKSRC
ncbi:hypothetical protein Tco_0950667 [Tanacetum coccineum]